MAREGSGRGSSLSMGWLPVPWRGPLAAAVATHVEADLLRGELIHWPRRRQAAAGHHGDAGADGKELIQILRHDEDGGAGLGQGEQELVNGGGRAGVDAPR